DPPAAAMVAANLLRPRAGGGLGALFDPAAPRDPVVGGSRHLRRHCGGGAAVARADATAHLWLRARPGNPGDPLGRSVDLARALSASGCVHARVHASAAWLIAVAPWRGRP